MTAEQERCTTRLKYFAVLIGLCVAVVGGCSKQTAKVLPTCIEKSEDPVDAADAVRRVLLGFQQNELQAFWVFLPQSFRSDVDHLAREFGERSEDKSWRPFVATCRKAREVVSKLIKQFEREGQAIDDVDRELIDRLRDTEQVLYWILKSDLSDLTRLRQFDGTIFLSQISKALQTRAAHHSIDGVDAKYSPFSMLHDVKIELLDSTEDSAVLTVQWPGQEPTQHKFVRVEEHWIPQTLGEAWPTEFPKVREQVLAWADELHSNPEPWHARLREIDQLLDELAATKSLAETRQVWQAGASRLAVAWLGLAVSEPLKAEEIPVESPSPTKPVRMKKPDTEVLLPDEPEK